MQCGTVCHHSQRWPFKNTRCSPYQEFACLRRNLLAVSIPTSLSAKAASTPLQGLPPSAKSFQECHRGRGQKVCLERLSSQWERWRQLAGSFLSAKHWTGAVFLSGGNGMEGRGSRCHHRCRSPPPKFAAQRSLHPKTGPEIPNWLKALHHAHTCYQKFSLLSCIMCEMALVKIPSRQILYLF